MAECTSDRILTCESNGRAFDELRAERKSFGHAPIHCRCSFNHLRPPREQTDYLWIQIEAARYGGDCVSDRSEHLVINAGLNDFNGFGLWGLSLKLRLRTLLCDDRFRTKLCVLIAAVSLVHQSADFFFGHHSFYNQLFRVQCPGTRMLADS